jgi:hypothetical protein
MVQIELISPVFQLLDVGNCGASNCRRTPWECPNTLRYWVRRAGWQKSVSRSFWSNSISPNYSMPLAGPTWMKDLLYSVFQRTPLTYKQEITCVFWTDLVVLLYSWHYVVTKLLITEQNISSTWRHMIPLTDFPCEGLPVIGSVKDSIAFSTCSGMSNCTWAPFVLPLLVRVLEWQT